MENYIIILSLIVTFFTLIVLVCHWIHYPHEYSKYSNRMPSPYRFNPTILAHGLIGLGLLFGTLYVLSFNLYLGSVISFFVLFFDLLWFRKIIKNKSK